MSYKQMFLTKAANIHGSRYDYSLVPDMFTYKTIIPIICNKHGIFYQKANQHATVSNCQQCSQESRYVKNYNTRRHTLQDFIAKASAKHNHYYDYSTSCYVGQMKPITIICPKHGPFTCIANNHIHGMGCNKCKRSRGETAIINFLMYHDIEFTSQKQYPDLKTPESTAKTFNHPKYDFFLPTYNLLIEFDGKQHFEPVRFRGVDQQEAIRLHERTKYVDNIKNKYAENNKINLLRIPHTDIKNIYTILTKQLEIT